MSRAKGERADLEQKEEFLTCLGWKAKAEGIVVDMDMYLGTRTLMTSMKGKIRTC